jgi:hypothetical protein
MLAVMNNQSVVVALAGRRVDAPGALPRFPHARIPVVKRALEDELRRLSASALVSGAACGADLLAIEVATALGLRCRLVLPFAAARFRGTSVVDRGDEWGPRFDDALARAQSTDDVVVLEDGAETDDETYLRANEAILDQALTVAAGRPVVAIVVWDRRTRDGIDVTAEFAASARNRGLPVEEISTIDERA